MNKLSKEKRIRIFLIGIGALIVAGTLWYFLIQSQNETIRKHGENITTVLDQIDKAERRIKRAPAVEEDLRSLRQQIAEAEREMLPVEQLSGRKWMFDKLVTFIENKYDVRLLMLSQSPIVGKQFLILPKFEYSTAAFNVELQGHFHEFGRFLADFENAFPYMSIQTLEISSLATPSGASGPTTDLPDDFVNSDQREHLKISMRVVVLFKPASS